MAVTESRTHRVERGSRPIEFTLVRCKRKTLSIRIRPDGTVEVRAPIKAPLPWIDDVVGRRAAWIEKHVERIARLRREHPVPRYVADELYAFLGRQYRLALERAPEPLVSIAGERLLVRGPELPQPEAVKRQLDGWFAEQCRRVFVERLERCLPLFPDPARVRPERVSIRPMISRWGSMSSTGRMSLNSRLIHMPLACIDYVIIHELCHRLEPNHGPGFWLQVAAIMPGYRDARTRLKQEAMSRA